MSCLPLGLVLLHSLGWHDMGKVAKIAAQSGIRPCLRLDEGPDLEFSLHPKLKASYPICRLLASFTPGPTDRRRSFHLGFPLLRKALRETCN